MMAKMDILNGFVGKVISDCIDISINAIKKADKNRKSKNQTVETRIYQVTIDALNKFPYNKYKKEEKVYDAAERILKELAKGNSDYKESVRFGINMLSSEITGDICEDFLELLCYEICREENNVLFKEVVLIQQEQLSENVNGGFKDSNRNHKETHKKLDEIQENINSLKNRKDIVGNLDSKDFNKIPMKNRAEEYADKWDKNVFLNNYDERDEKKGKNIKLKELYLEGNLPHYKWKSNINESNDLKKLLCEYVVDNFKRKMLLILGYPGIGKSTLITWIIANLIEKREQVLVYQFASDLKNVRWDNDNILNSILKTISLNYNEVENKILILDGFDEIYASNDRGRILNRLFYELKEMNYVKRFSLIITCRENYIDKLDILKCDYITLQAWNTWQIRSFCGTYSTISNIKITECTICRILDNKEVFGIPLILYMVLVLNIDIEKSSSIVDVYDQIFSQENGGIYNRCIKNINYAPPHRIEEIKQQIHQISQRIAFWIFENNPEKAFINQKDFKGICDTLIDEMGEGDIQSDVLIGNYFKLIRHCEGVGTEQIQFVHRSIYEYFVAVYFFESIHKLKSKEKVAGKLGELLKDGRLSEQILEFIRYKFDSIKGINLANITKEVFNIMLRDGMAYYAEKKYKDIIRREMNIFSSMLEVVCIWNGKLGELDNKIVFYLQCNRRHKLNLRGVNLSTMYPTMNSSSKLDLKKVYLREANLQETDLRNVDLSGADLVGADLRRANLSEAEVAGADLRGAKLNMTNFRNANLIGADLGRADLYEIDLREADINKINLFEPCFNEVFLDEKQIEYLDEKYDLIGSRVYIFETKEIISYNEYRSRKQKT